MVGGVGIGCRVKALATKAKPEGWCKRKWPGTWRVEYITGTVSEKVDRKWRVRWDYHFDAGESVISARSLQYAGDSVAQDVGASTVSSRNGGDASSRCRGDASSSDNGASNNGARISGGDTSSNAGGTRGDRDTDTTTPAAESELEESDPVDNIHPAFDEREQEASGNPGPDLLSPHGLQWTFQQDGIPVEPGNRNTNHSPQLAWPDHSQHHDRAAIEYFFLFFPTTFVAQMLSLTSDKLKAARCHELTEQEFFQFIGLMLLASLYPGLTLDELFNGIYPSYEFDVTPMARRYMTFARFNDIRRQMTFALKPLTPEERQRRGDFWAIRPLVAAFNECRRRVFIPGPKLVVGESFCAWCGRDDKQHGRGCPHVQKEKRKRPDIGIEIKNVACVTVGIMLVLELVASADEMHGRAHWAEGFASTALLLRLLQCFAGTGRTVLGNSAFASVQTAVHLFKRLGLFFIGLVKSCTRLYPFKFTQEYQYPHRGAHVALTAQHEGVNVRAVAWGDKKVKSFISTCGTTAPGIPHEKQRWRNNNNGTTDYFAMRVPRPKVVEEYYDGAQIIDVHNHLRQGVLGLEARPTKRWEHRFFQTFVGMVEVDAFKAHSYFHSRPVSHRDFTRAVAWGLINNLRGVDTASPLRPPHAKPPSERPCSARPHVIVPLRLSSCFTHRKRKAEETNRRVPTELVLRCRLCQRKTRHYCQTCSDESDPTQTRSFYAVCGPSAKDSSCFTDHVRTPGMVDREGT